MGAPGDVTILLKAWGAGDAAALEQLTPLVHAELKRIARNVMARERKGHSLQPTALVNEAYLRLIDVNGVSWQDRTHFLAIAARLMRRVLVDHARTRLARKRGGEAVRVTLDEKDLPAAQTAQEVTELDEALEALAEVDLRKSQVVEMRFFGGLSVEETAAALGVSEATVMRDWKLAKAWLWRHMKSAD
ncbi:MAG: sigma-70 family RNA polymerase sigma factor [Vicinamibacterales bacterium]